MPWSESFDLLIPRRRARDMAGVAESRKRGRSEAELRIRVRGDRITAVYRDTGRVSTASRVVGRLVEEPGGTRIVGRISWAAVGIQPYGAGGVAIVGVVAFVLGVKDGPWPLVLLGIALVLGFGVLAVLCARSRQTTKECEEARLRRGLLELFRVGARGR